MLIFLLIVSQVNYQPTGHWELSKIGITTPGPFEVRPDGGVAIYDADTMQLMMIDPRGTLKAKCGSKGSGAGQFQSPRRIEWLPDEKAYAVYDVTNRRVSKWDQTGRLMSEFELPKPLNNPKFLPDKTLLVSRHALGLHGYEPTLLVFNPKDQNRRVLWQYEDIPGDIASGANVEGKKFTLAMPWNAKMLYDMGSDFVAVAYGDTNHVHVLDFDGNELVTTMTVDLPIYPLTDDQFMAAFKDLPQAYRKNAAKISVRTPSWPRIRDIIVDDKDRIWVFGTAEKVGAPFPFEVYDATGQRLTTGKIGRIPGAISGGSMYAVIEQPTPILQKIEFSF